MHSHIILILNCMNYLQNWIIDNLDIFFAEVRCIVSKSLHLQGLRNLSEKDQQYQKLKKFIFNGFPSHCNQLPVSCKHY